MFHLCVFDPWNNSLDFTQLHSKWWNEMGKYIYLDILCVVLEIVHIQQDNNIMYDDNIRSPRNTKCFAEMIF